jgi:hypothetical protein
MEIQRRGTSSFKNKPAFRGQGLQGSIVSEFIIKSVVNVMFIFFSFYDGGTKVART